MVVKNTFGILTLKLKIYNWRIQVNPENAHQIFLSTCVLHNCIKINEGRKTHNREKNTNPAADKSALLNYPIQGGNASK